MKRTHQIVALPSASVCWRGGWLILACFGLLTGLAAASESAALSSVALANRAAQVAQTEQQPAAATQEPRQQTSERSASQRAEQAENQPQAARPRAVRSRGGVNAPQPQRAPGSIAGSTPTTRPTTQASRQTQGKGCGDASGQVPKPSPDGPQPKWTCEKPAITTEPVWRGAPLEYVFEIGNQGEGPLQIQLKGG
ncbi:MAG: hypothetical protein KKB50_02920 [Planctomycetes bacterium]|nr:hypothetical protein [Planctomycetota bacterium]